MRNFVLLTLIAVVALVSPSDLRGQESASPKTEQPAASAPKEPAKPPPKDNRLTLGVAGIKVNPSIIESAARSGKSLSLKRMVESMDGQMITRLNGTGKFTIVSRSDLDVVMKEQQFAASGNVDANDDNAAKSYKLAGAKYMVVVTVDDFQDQEEKAVFEAIGTRAVKRVVRFSTICKIYDTTTGKMLDSATIRVGDKDVNQSQNSTTSKDGELSDEMLQRMSHLMAEKLANRVVDKLYPARIVAKTGNMVTINRGDGTGIERDQVWNVYALGQEMIDPDTGLSLGREEVGIGRVRITDVRPKFSQAEVLEDRGIEKLQVLRPAE